MIDDGLKSSFVKLLLDVIMPFVFGLNVFMFDCVSFKGFS